MRTRKKKLYTIIFGMIGLLLLVSCLTISAGAAAAEGIYNRLSAGTQKVDIGLRNVFTTSITAQGGVGVSKDVSSLASCEIEDSRVAMVGTNCSIYSVLPGTTVLHVNFEGLTMDIPVVVSEKYRIKTDPPKAEQSSLDVYSGVDLAALGKQRQEALSLINMHRSALNLTPFTLDESLNKAAQAHANYSTLKKDLGHIENKGEPGFSGTMPSMRAQAFGYPNISVGEVVSPIVTNSIASVQSLLNAPLHRMLLLGPGSDEAGIGISKDQLIINPGTKRFGERLIDRSIVIYPYTGQQQVPTSWLANESPNPLAYYKQEGEQVGYPISISTSYTFKLIYKSASLTDSAGQAVDYYLVDSEHKGVDEAILLIPKKALKAGETYNVKINLNQTSKFNEEYGIPSEEFTKSWSFTTRQELISTLSLEKAVTTVEEGKSVQLPKVFASTKEGTKHDVSHEAVFSTESERVTIENGSLKGMSAGSAVIQASYGGQMVSFTVTVMGANSFNDMSLHWARDAVNWGRNRGITNGYEDGTFKPDNRVSEEEFLKMLFKLYETEISNAVKEQGASKGNWNLGTWSDRYYYYAYYYNLGLEKGATDKVIRQKTITRYQVATIIAGLNGKHYSSDEDAVRFLLDIGFSTGKTAPTVEGYQGKDPLTRAEAVQFLRNLTEQGMDSIQGRPQQATAFVKADRYIKASYGEEMKLVLTGRFTEYAGHTVKVRVRGPLTKLKILQEYTVTLDSEGYLSLTTSAIKDDDQSALDGLVIDVEVADNYSYQTKVNHMKTFYNVYSVKK